ncbi:hypothetical protein [Streptomyces formicae]|uniref:Uncharacterized protein n=1 Tax=Streptomyces formicae TaxID=1616117 RepID=A0ABY3WCT2_9ACTN|nr:hypothetical protein [Streptomyces formicae]UNM10378.1 hypothetical protein J4032_01620 [Streptomyces formicae]
MLLRSRRRRCGPCRRRRVTGYEPELIRAEPLRCAVQWDGDARLAPVTAACRETGTVAVVGAAVHDGGDQILPHAGDGTSPAATAR